MGLFSGIANFVSGAVDKVASVFRPGPKPSPFPFPPDPFPLPFPLKLPFSLETSTSTSHSSSTTTYEPERVKAAQIEADSKIKLATMEQERLEYMRQAKLDIIEAEKESRIAQEQARAQGFREIAQALTDMQEKLTEIAKKRIAIIEGGTLQAVREAENFYAELSAKIQEDNDRYTREKLPALLEILGRYGNESPAQRLYMRKIEEDITLQALHTTRQLESVVVRQERMIDEIMTAKGKITEQTGAITAGILEVVRERLEALPGIERVPELSEEKMPALPE